MKWFTIFIEWPRRQLTETEENSITRNSAGQIIAYDGQTDLEQAVRLGETLAEAWDNVWLFQGKTMGRCVAAWKRGQML